MPDNKYQVNDINYYGTHVPKNPENLKSYSALFALTPYVGKATITKLQDSVMTEKMATMSANNLWSSNKNILESIRAVMNATVANNIAPVEPKQGDLAPNKQDVGTLNVSQVNPTIDMKQLEKEKPFKINQKDAIQSGSYLVKDPVATGKRGDTVYAMRPTDRPTTIGTPPGFFEKNPPNIDIDLDKLTKIVVDSIKPMNPSVQFVEQLTEIIPLLREGMEKLARESLSSEKSDTKYLTPEGKSVNKAIVDSVTKPNTNIQKEMGQIETNDELRAYEQAWRKQLRKENPKASEKELEKMVFDAVSDGMMGEATRLPEGFVPEKLKFLMPKNKNK